MKKTYFIAAAVTLAVLFAGCDGFLQPPEAAGGNEEGLIISFRTSDGSITSDGSRALTTPIAAAGADFFEVVFNNGSRKVRTSWGNGATGRIIPGDGDYDNSGVLGAGTPPKGRAYIFAGRNGTLLGVGVLVDVIEGSTSTGLKIINMSVATQVVFEITALNTDVGGLLNPTGLLPADPINGSNPAASTFQIELEPSSPFSGNMVGPLLLDNSQNPPLTAPVFVVNPSSSPLDASFDITDTNGKSLSESDYDDIRNAIITPSTSNTLNRVYSSGFLWEAGNSPFANVTGTITSISAVDAPLTLPIALDVTPGTKAGLAKLSIEIPVFMYDSATAANGAAPITWYIRGGLNNFNADQGAAFNDGDGSLGGAILIGVGDYNKNAAGLIIGFSEPMFN